LGCALHRGDQHILHYGSGPGYAARGTCRCYLTCISAQGARLDGRTYGNMTRRGWLYRAGYPRARFRISRRRKACFVARQMRSAALACRSVATRVFRCAQPSL